MTNIGVIRFPGTNNEYETLRALKSFDVNPVLLDHKEVEKIDKMDGIWLPGGFSYGDVLRAGAIAAQSEILQKIKKSDLPTLGACNGFQIQTETNLLPGALIPNTSTRFICKWIYIKLNHSFFDDVSSSVLKLPIAHFEGNYYDPNPSNVEHQSFAKYSDKTGDIKSSSNPNGSIKNIAGVISEDSNHIGLMPHPERASFDFQGSTDGRIIIEKFLQQVRS